MLARAKLLLVRATKTASHCGITAVCLIIQMHFDICSKKISKLISSPLSKSAFNLHCAIAKILVFHKQQKP